eukprot:scaffold2120_cov150-Skeletonema_dohrnii-CCMP3373.AAC.6
MAGKDAIKLDEDAHLASLQANRSHNSLPCSSKRIAHVELFRPKKVLPQSSTSTKKRYNIKSYHLLFLTLYIHQLYWIISTMGTPYTQFLLKAEREGFTVMEGSAKLRAELSHALGDITDENRYDSTKKLGWFDWMNMDIEEHAAVKKRMKEQSVLDSLPKSQRVPKRHAPTFVSMLFTGILVTVHLLVVLLQVWSVKFNVWMNFVSVDSSGGGDNGSDEDGGGVLDIPEEWMELDEEENPLLKSVPVKGVTGGATGGGASGATSISSSKENIDQSTAKTLMERIEYNNSIISIPNHLPTHVVITPSKAGESKVLLPVLYVPTLGVTFEYHRRRYYLSQDHDEEEGISSNHQLEAAGVRFGENKFDVRQPTFKDMYKKQLLSPFTAILGVYIVHDFDL